MSMDSFEQARLQFLRRVAEQPDGAQRKHIRVADRKQDRVRQTARADGLVVFTCRGKGLRWFITPKGQEYLDARNGGEA